MSTNAARVLDEWVMIFEAENTFSTCQVFLNEATSEMDLIQIDDEGESMTTHLSEHQVRALREALTRP